MKVYVLDTSVLMHDPAAIENLKDNTIVVPIWVIEELDCLKRESGSRGENARQASRVLDAYREQGSLKDGVKTHNGGTIYVDYTGGDFTGLPVGLEETNDNRVILVALCWQKDHGDRDVVVISKDTNLRIKANACGITAQDYQYDKQIASPDELYSGIATLYVQENSVFVFDELFSKDYVDVSAVAEVLSQELPELLANQCCHFKSEHRGALAIFKKKENRFRMVKKRHTHKGNFEVVPINAEQAFAYALLTDHDIGLVTLAGKAGTGKTLMALLAGWRQLDSRYRQLMVYRPNIEVGRPLGYLPGSLDEKFEPWMKPIFDNLDLIISGHSNGQGELETQNLPDKKKGKRRKSSETVLKEALEQGRLEISPINFVQGRTLHQRFVIVDEAQNLTPLDMKIVITRIGEGSKIVLTGDPEQIVSPYLDATSNGLTHVIQRLKGQETYGHITMKCTERSQLAEIAADLL